MTGPDPRIEAASDALGLAGYRPPDDALEAALAAADAVDPLRAPSRLDRVAEIYADPEGWPDADD